MNAMFVFARARRLAGTAITVNPMHPDVVAGTGLGGEVPGLGKLVKEAYREGRMPPLGSQSGGAAASGTLDFDNLPGPDVGADPAVWLATSSEVDGVTGRFFVDRAAHHRYRTL